MKIQNIFTRNILLKIISLIIAVILWVSYGRISGEKTITHIDIAPTFSNLPQGFEIVTQDIGSIRLRIQGNTNVLKNISNADFSVNIDLGSVKEPSELDIVVLPLLEYPSQVEILEVNPVSLDIFVDRTATENIPLTIDSENISNLPYGKSISRIDLIPSTVTVEGPESEIGKLGSIGIKPISLPGTSEQDSIMVNGQLDIPARSSIRWKSQTRRVGVHIFFSDIIDRREIRRIPIKVFPEGIRYSLSQTYIDALVSGPVILLDQMEESGYFARVNVSGINFKRNDSLDLSPQLLNQDKLSDISINPKVITITFNESLQEYNSRIK